MKKFLYIYILTIICFIAIMYLFNRYKKNIFESGIYDQYVALNFFYQTGNFTKPFTDQYLYKNIGDTSATTIKVPITCNKSGCFTPYEFKVESLEGDFAIGRILVYETLSKDFQNQGPYYFYYNDSSSVKKGDKFVLDHNFIYENFSGKNVPQIIHKKYGEFIFQNPVEMYYRIYPISITSTGAYCKFSLEKF